MKDGLFRRIYKQNPQEKGGFEITPEGEVIRNEKISELEGKEMVETLAHSEIIQEKINDVIEVLNKELNLVVPCAIENPDDFRKRLEEDSGHESVDKVLDVIDKNIRALSLAYDKLDEVYEEVLNQRLDYKDVSDIGVNKEMKTRLDDRIHKLQAYKKTAHELIDYLDSKRAESILRGEKEGSVFGHEGDEDIDG